MKYYLVNVQGITLPLERFVEQGINTFLDSYYIVMSGPTKTKLFARATDTRKIKQADEKARLRARRRKTK